VQGISDIITIPGIINRDYTDVKTTMAGMGYAVMGTATRSGANRAVEAARAAMASPLLGAGAIKWARGILINISGSSSLTLSEVNRAAMMILNTAHEEAHVVFGAVMDETMGDNVKITVIATGISQQVLKKRSRKEALGSHAEHDATAIIEPPLDINMGVGWIEPVTTDDKGDEARESAPPRNIEIGHNR
jgi:cell division protein FtsZ